MTSDPTGATRPYVDRPVADLEAAQRAAERAAVHWSLDAPTLVRAGMNAIYRAGPVVLRVGRPSIPGDTAIRLARALHDHGITVALPALDEIATMGRFTVTCWQRLVEVDEAIDWAAVGRMVRRVHQLDSSVLPADYPQPAPCWFPWWDFDALLAEVGASIDEPAQRGLRAAVDRWPDWWLADEPVVCHGDVHPGNVMMTAAGPVLIDWDLLCSAARSWDHGPMMTWHERWGGPTGEYERFADGYGASFRGDPAAEAIAELRLVAATLMRVRAALANPAARDEAERRLRFWRGDPDAPMWSAQ